MTLLSSHCHIGQGLDTASLGAPQLIRRRGIRAVSPSPEARFEVGDVVVLLGVPDGLAAGEPARLMGYPVLICEDMPDIAAGAHAIAFGDFRAGYTIAERPDLRILRDPFSAKPHVLFYASKRVGGDVTDYAAIKLLRFAVS